MLRVLPCEHDLLAILRAATGAIPPRAVTSLLMRAGSAEDRETLARGLSPDARRALEQTLARGCARALLRRGGWQNEVFAAHDGIERGRVWERRREPLSFTMVSFELLRWLTLEPIGHRDCRLAPKRAPAGNGDELLLYLVCDLLAALDLPLDAIRTLVARSRLAQLAFPDALVGVAGEEPSEIVAGVLDLPVLIGGLQADLARQLVRLETHKARIVSPRELERVSRLAEERLDGLVDAAAGRGHIDRLRFIAEAAGELVKRDGSHPQLDAGATMTARHEARRAAAGVMRVVARVAGLSAALRSVGFVDDGYEQAQALLTAWERHMPALTRAGEVARAWTSF